jgi:phosphopantothenoylcysteine decarboxylase/phosphopantothenate--cysteine ligase
VLITAGPTHEAIDPVRYLTNGSTGKMGYALAEAACEAGAQVTLVSGPVQLSVPAQVNDVQVVSAQEMHAAVMQASTDCDIFIGVAAVSDYRSKQISEHKQHKLADTMTIELVRNPDIIASVGELSDKPFIVGFAAETENMIASARDKRARKKMDLIIANLVGKQVGMASDENAVTVIGDDIEMILPLASKSALARQLIAIIAQQFHQQRQHVNGEENEIRNRNAG